MCFWLALVLLAGCREHQRFSDEKIYNQARLSLDRGDLKFALQTVDELLRNSPPRDSYWFWKLTTLKAEILMQQRHTQECVALLRAELPANLADTDVDLWRKLTLGSADAYNLRFELAEKQFAEAEALANAKFPERLGDVLLRKGTLALTQNDHATAIADYQAALAAARKWNNPFLQSSSLANLALVATRQEHFDEALQWNLEALEKAKAMEAKSYIAIISGNIGWSYLEMGDDERALEVLEQARAAAENAGMMRLQIDVLVNMGIAHYQRKEYDLSKSDNLRALELATSIADRAAMADCYRNLTQLALATGQMDFAQQNQERVAQFVRSYPNPKLELFSFLVRGRLQQNRGQYKEAEASFGRVIQDSAATAAQRWEAQARRAETFDLEHKEAEADQEYRVALDTIEAARASFGEEELRLAFLSRPIVVYGEYIEFLLKHGRGKEALEIAERSRAITLEEGLASRGKSRMRTSQEVQPQELSRRLKATLFCYWLGEKKSYLWAVTPVTTRVFELPASAEIQAAVRRYRQAILEARDVLREENGDGKLLYAMLVEPARELVAKDARIFLLPSESLYALNFETLLVTKPKPHYWLEDVTISTASSLKLLSSAARRPDSLQKSLLLLGNPDSATKEFPQLAQAAEEINRTEAHFAVAQRKVLEGNRATASAYLQSRPEHYSYLHFATHGTASHTRPLESAVILSREGDSYKLYARDILAHPLQAQLVTISACDGAGTRAYAGEGLVGLAWAFLRAGARSVIASLWEVSDAHSTPQLIDGMYSGLDRGEDPATALRNAKLNLLKAESQSVFSKPYYWAPFQIYAGS